MTWDGGNQLTYPVKYHSITYAEESGPPPANVTGYELMGTLNGEAEGEEDMRAQEASIF